VDVSAALWGFIGGCGYAGTRLSASLWGGKEITSRARSHAIAQFGLSLILAPAASYAFTPIVLGFLPRATTPSVSLMVGLCFNAVWPLLMEPKFLRQLIADLARGLANKLVPGGE
jgi:hypothetical protein